jgi:hypothetical protein
MERPDPEVKGLKEGLKGARVDFPKSRYWRDGKGGTTDYGF